MAILNTPLLGLPYAGADTDETYAVLARLFVKDGQKLTLPEIVEQYTPTVGTVYIKAADWTAADGTADEYDAKITISGVELNSMILLYPATDGDAEKAKRLGIRAKAASGVANDDTFVIVRATGGDPTVTEGINLVYIALRGYAVWSAGLTPPTLPYATVIGVDPYIATAEGERDDIAASQGLVTRVAEVIRKSVDDLAKTAIDKSVTDLVNYYTKSQTLTKDEINALVSAIQKFNIEVVTSLPTSNISETTVYLVKSGDDDTNLYTEYIRTNGKWEKLGTQTVDLTGYATEAWVNDILAAYVKTVDMEAYVTGLLAGYLTPTTGDQRYAAKQATETALIEHGNKIDELEEALENATIKSADSVEWLEAHGDKAKKYSLPDGYVYEWMQKLVKIANNALVTNGYVRNARPSSSVVTGNNERNGLLAVNAIHVNASTDSSSKINITWPTADGSTKYLVVNYYQPVYVHFYDSDGNQIGFESAFALGVGEDKQPLALPATLDLKNSTYYSNADTIRLMLGITTAAYIEEVDIEGLVVNCVWLDRQEYVWGWYNTGNKVNDDETTKQNTADIADLQGRMTVVEEKIASGVSTGPLFAKLGLIGDSLTAQPYQGWQPLVVSMLGGPELHKNAIVGSCVATYENQEKPSFVDRYLETPEDCDCIVIMGGTNDSTKKGGNDMGEVGVLNNNTFKGAYSKIIEGLLTRNPATRVMLMTPPRSYATNYEERTATKLYAEATVEVAKFYGLPCLDFYDTLGWNAVTAPWCARDFTGENSGSVDTLHFSDAIGPRVGRMVANFIKTYY